MYALSLSIYSTSFYWRFDQHIVFITENHFLIKWLSLTVSLLFRFCSKKFTFPYRIAENHFWENDYRYFSSFTKYQIKKKTLKMMHRPQALVSPFFNLQERVILSLVISRIWPSCVPVKSFPENKITKWLYAQNEQIVKNVWNWLKIKQQLIPVPQWTAENPTEHYIKHTYSITTKSWYN